MYILRYPIVTLKNTLPLYSHGGKLYNNTNEGRRGRIVVGFTTTYAISAYHH